MGHFGSKSGVQVVYENSSIELSGTLSRGGKKEASVLGVLPCKLNNVMLGDRSPLSFLVVGYSYGSAMVVSATIYRLDYETLQPIAKLQKPKPNSLSQT
jgi:hypothetical protein